MIINDENKEWATNKLFRFRDWRGFPQNHEDVDARARAFLRLVHNKPAREIVVVSPSYVAVCEREGVPIPEIDWKAKGIAPDQNDAEWLLDMISETMDFFPLPVQMRELYVSTGGLPPASTFGEAPARED